MIVESYGTGSQVRLPGKSAMEPQIFKFGTPYSEMYRSLAATPQDEAFFMHNGVLQLCKRGASVKVSDLIPKTEIFIEIISSIIHIHVNDQTVINDCRFTFFQPLLPFLYLMTACSPAMARHTFQGSTKAPCCDCIRRENL